MKFSLMVMHVPLHGLAFMAALWVVLPLGPSCCRAHGFGGTIRVSHITPGPAVLAPLCRALQALGSWFGLCWSPPCTMRGLQLKCLAGEQQLSLISSDSLQDYEERDQHNFGQGK